MKQVKMQFAVELVTKHSGMARIGNLIHLEKSEIQTPCFLHTTKGGSIPHLSKEVFNMTMNENITNQILQVSLATTDHMEEALKVTKSGLATFVGYPELPISLCFQDPCEVTTGFNEKNIVPLFTRRGKQIITAEKYMKLLEVMKPDICHALCDSDTNIDSTAKRMQKSVDRTETFFKICLEKLKDSEELKKSLFLAPIVGGYSKAARSMSVQSVTKITEVDGYLLEGFHNFGDTSINIDLDLLKAIVSHTIKEIDDDKVRFMYGAYNPLIVLEMIRLGVDVFDTSFVYIASQNFKALTFSFDINDEINDKLEFFIDLSDEKYKDKFVPFLEGCSCLACRKHTRAYSHHLMKTNELLGPILLMIHNTHHYKQFFDAIRKSIEKDELQKLIDFLRNQICDEKVHIVADKASSDLKKRI